MKYAILALFLLTASYAAILPAGAHLTANVEKYSPFPAEPGAAVTAWIRINNAGETAKDVTFSVNADNPLTLLSDSAKKYDAIYNRDDVLLEYKFAVGQSAQDGPAGFRFSYSMGGVTTEYNFSVTVENSKKRADLRALFVSTKPEARTGETSTLTIDVANTASGTAYYTIAKASTPAGIIKRDEVYVGNLAPDDFNSVDFDVAATAKPGKYPVYITFDYKDSDDITYTTNETVSMTVLPATGNTNVSVWNYLAALVMLGVAAKYFVLPRLRRKK